MSEKKVCHKSRIGGQALIEGIMMRGIDYSSMAVRLPNGEIDLEKWSINNGKNAPWYRKTPFVRGIFNLITSMVEGYKCLSKSAEISAEAEDEELTDFEKKLDKILGDKLMVIVTVFATIVGVALAIGLFIFLPTLLIWLLGKVIPIGGVGKAFLEGILKIALLIGYMALTSLLKDIRRTYEYHGAEHKTIACYEGGEELTVENVKKYSRFHPRCGTSFLLIVMVVGIAVFAFVSLSNPVARFALRIALMPVVVGVSYEIIRIAGRYQNIATKIISAPGMALQRLTTRDPDGGQIEVAITALEAVIPENIEDDQW